MLKLFLIGVGGAIGTLLRYVVTKLDFRFSSGIFPIGTFVVNVSGSLIIGFLWGMFERMDISSTVRTFILIGILGGYTTFSTFSLESFNLLRDGEFKIALINVIATNLIAVVFVYLGFSAARWILEIIR
jgi:fluoride exporter